MFILGFFIVYMAASFIGNSVSDQTVGTHFSDYGFIVKIELGIILTILCLALLFWITRKQVRGNFQMLKLSGQTSKKVLVKLETTIKHRSKNQIINSIQYDDWRLSYFSREFEFKDHELIQENKDTIYYLKKDGDKILLTKYMRLNVYNQSVKDCKEIEEF